MGKPGEYLEWERSYNKSSILLQNAPAFSQNVKPQGSMCGEEYLMIVVKQAQFPLHRKLVQCRDNGHPNPTHSAAKGAVGAGVQQEMTGSKKNR